MGLDVMRMSSVVPVMIEAQELQRNRAQITDASFFMRGFGTRDDQSLVKGLAPLCTGRRHSRASRRMRHQVSVDVVCPMDFSASCKINDKANETAKDDVSEHPSRVARPDHGILLFIAGHADANGE